jgi:hypothetical protein
VSEREPAHRAGSTSPGGWPVLAVHAGAASLPATAAFGPTTPLLALLFGAAAAICVRSPRIGVLLTVGALLLLPLPFSFSIGPITASAGRILLWITVVASLARSRVTRPRTSLDLPAVLVLATMSLSLVVNLPSLATFEVAGAMRKIFVFAVDLFALHWVVVREYKERHDRLRLVRVATAVVGLIAVLAVIEYFTRTNVFLRLGSVIPPDVEQGVQSAVAASDETLGRGLIRRVIGTLEQPLALGIVLAMGLPLAVALAYRAATRTARMLWVASSIAMGLAVIFTAARSVYVIVLVTFLTLLVLVGDRRLRAGIVVVGVLLGGLFLVQPDVRTTMIVFFQPQRGNQVEGSFANRTADYEPIARRVDDSPVFGFGPRTFSRDQLERTERVPDPRNLVLDNAYLGHLAETGFAGLSALLLLLFTAWLGAWRHLKRCASPADRILATALLCVVQSWILMGLAADVYNFHAPPRVFFILLAVAALERTGGRTDQAAVRTAATPTGRGRPVGRGAGRP